MSHAFVMRAALVACVLIAAPRAATAGDPVVVRQPQDGRALAVAFGVPQSSVGFRFANGFGVAAMLRLPVTEVSVDASFRWMFFGREDGFGLVLGAWAGVSIPTVEPAFAVDLGLSLQARLKKRWFLLQVGAVSPCTLRLTQGFLSRTPVAVELWLGAELGRVSFGLQGAAGVTLISAQAPVPYLQASAFVGVGL